MIKAANVLIALAAVTLTAAIPFPVDAQPPASDGKVIVFVTEGSEHSGAGTRLREYDSSASCQAFPPGAHVIADQSSKRLLLYSDPLCAMPMMPPFNFIKPGYGAHVSPTGGFKAE